MKKAIAILTVLQLLLCLCACEEIDNIVAAANSGQLTESGNQTAEETDKLFVEGQVEVPPTPALSEMTVTLSFGPEIELVLTEHFQLVSGKGLNEAGEALLDGIDLEDRTHYMLIRDILEKAREQGLLEQSTRLEMTAESENASIWHMFSKEILSLPAEHYMEESGLYFFQMVKLPKAAPAQFVPEQYAPYTDQGEGYACEGNMDISTGRSKLRWTFPESDKIAYTFRELDYIDLSFEHDGSFRYTRHMPNGRGTDANGKSQSRYLFIDYAERTDGSWNTSTTHLLDGAGVLGETFESNYGLSFEAVYDVSGRCLKRAGTEAGGAHYPEDTYYEETYHENGNVATNTHWTKDGTVVVKNTFYPNGNQKDGYSLDADGGIFEISCFENGNIEYEKRIDKDGFGFERTYYESGMEKTYKDKYTSGSYFEYALNEDGTWQYLKEVNETLSMELFYEEGTLVKVVLDGIPYEDENTLTDYRNMGY